MDEMLDPGRVLVVPVCWRGLSPAAMAECEADLTPTERERAAAFRRAEDRARYITARGLLRSLSARLLGRDPATLVQAETAQGKPFWANAPTLAFSLSHSGDWVYFGFANERALGIDVQVVQPSADALGIARIAMSEADAAALAVTAENERLAAFHAVWVLREAALKATGDGVFGAPAGFSVWPVPTAGAWFRRDYPEHGSVWLCLLEAADDHFAAVATGGSAPPTLTFALAEDPVFRPRVSEPSLGSVP